MPFLRPVTRTVISTTEFGQPVYDWIIANTPTPWVPLTLQNGYVWQAGGFYQPAYRKRSADVVELRGVITGPANSDPTGGLVFATLPAGFRPPAQSFPTVGNWTGAIWSTARIGVSPNGNLQIGFTTGQYVDVTCYFTL